MSPVFYLGLSLFLVRPETWRGPGGNMLFSSVYTGLAPQLPVTASVERTLEPKLPEPSRCPVGTGKPHPTHDRNDL